MQSIQERFRKNVIPSYSRFDLALERGQGCRVWDVNGKCYLDLGAGIAVCALGHASPDITAALLEQSGKLIHVSNLYYQQPQGLLAEQLAGLIGPGRIFFCNSGGEATEGLFKLARKFGHDQGRFEILTAENSFHGRTLAGIAATGQAKVKKGFEPMVPGFRHIPFNDLAAARAALSPATAAILIEGVQGEGGVTAATAPYLLGLRQLCDEKNLLLLMDGVQCGHFRTGRFQSFQRILEDADRRRPRNFCPTASRWPSAGRRISHRRVLGARSPTRTCWARARTAALSAARRWLARSRLNVLQVIERDGLAANARAVGVFSWPNWRSGGKISARYPAGARPGLDDRPGTGGDIPAFAGSDKAAAINLSTPASRPGCWPFPPEAESSACSRADFVGARSRRGGRRSLNPVSHNYPMKNLLSLEKMSREGYATHPGRQRGHEAPSAAGTPRNRWPANAGP